MAHVLGFRTTRKQALRLLLAASLAAAPSAAQAAPSHATDAGDGLVIQVPRDVPTLAEAVAVASAGTTILLAEGIWSGPGFGGLLIEVPLHLVGAGGSAACIVDGEGQGDLFASLPWSLANGTTFRGLTLRNFEQRAISSSASIEIRDCRFESCSYTGDPGGAIRLGGSSGVSLIDRSVFWRNSSPVGGGAVWVSGQTALVSRCTFLGNKGTLHFFSFFGDDLELNAGADVTIVDSILWSAVSEAAAVHMSGTQTTLSIATTDIVDGEAGVAQAAGTQPVTFGPGVLSANPKFVNPQAGDFRLQPGSPCINTGDAAGDPDADGSPPDMGAVPYEPWTNLGGGVSGTAGPLRLRANGPLTAASTVDWDVEGGGPGLLFVLVVGLSASGVPFKGGVLWPQPDEIVRELVFDDAGLADGMLAWPPGMPAGAGLWLQAWSPDPGAPAGLTGSNGVQGIAP